MIKCSKCNKTFDNDFDFCPYCGEKSPKQKICPECGFKSNEFNFCPKCGINLLTEIEIQKIQVKEYYKEAIKLEANEEYEEALKYYNKAIELDPTNTENKEKLKELKKLHHQKEKQYREALNLEKQSWYHEALDYCKKVLELDPNNTKNKETLEELKEKLQAEEYYLEAIELEQKGKYSEARSYCRKAITKDPKNTKYKEKLEELQEKNAEKIKRLNEKKVSSKNRGYKKPDVNQALHKVEKLQAEDHYKKAIKFEEEGKYESSIECINKAIKLEPKNRKYTEKLEELQTKTK